MFLRIILILSLFVPPLFAQDPAAKIVTVSDEASEVAGRTSVSDYHGALPQGHAGSRAVSQMPGWPITVGAAQNFAPSRGLVFADLDNDGTLEIVFSSTDKKIYAWDYTGAMMPGFPKGTIEMPQYAPSVGDLDGDGDLEIVQLTRGMTSGGRMYILDHQGNTLPGFPKSVNNNNLSSCPTLYDLDDDGDKEIIVAERAYPLGYLHVFEYDGSEWGGNWPVGLDHVPTGTPAVGDLDQDGDVEIVHMSYDSLYVWELDGTIAAGWPKQISNANFSYQSAALADLDGDGDLEIVVGAHKNAAGCYVFHHDGTAYPGWPKLLGTWTYCPPTVVDLAGDGVLEILDGRAGAFGGYSNCFWAWTHAGTVKTGFPYASSHGGGSDGPLTVADVNNDGYMEIFADHNVMDSGTSEGWLFGVDSFGNDLPGFPLRPKGFTYMNGATIGDVDGDGDYELGVVSYYDLYVDVGLYDLTGTYHPVDVKWETYHLKKEKGGPHKGEDRLHVQGYMGQGSTFNIYLHDDPGSKVFLWLSVAGGKAHHKKYGWFYLSLTPPMPFNLLFDVPLPGSGEYKMSLVIPVDPGLTNLPLYLQGLVGPDPLSGDGRFTNMLKRIIQ